MNKTGKRIVSAGIYQPETMEEDNIYISWGFNPNISPNMFYEAISNHAFKYRPIDGDADDVLSTNAKYFERNYWSFVEKLAADNDCIVERTRLDRDLPILDKIISETEGQLRQVGLVE